MRFRTESENQTYELAQKLAGRLEGGEIIRLSGDLGAGKTVFARGIARALGYKGEVLSPTFTVMNDYEGEKLRIYHYDAYRLSSGEEAYFSGLTDYFGVSDGVCIIEWADNIADALKDYKCIDVHVAVLGESTREIEIS